MRAQIICLVIFLLGWTGIAFAQLEVVTVTPAQNGLTVPGDSELSAVFNLGLHKTRHHR